MRTPDSERGNCVFQIAYDLMQLVTRARLLKRQGYDVVSAFGSETAKHLLAKNPDYRVQLFILGHNAPLETREEMVQWLREHFPSAKILALNAPQDKLAGADWNFLVNSAEEWLPAIAAA